MNDTINRCIFTLYHHWSPPQYRSAKSIQKGDSKQPGSLWHTRKVHHHVTLANDEADHKIEARLNRLTHKDPILVGDKVLIHRPQSTMALSSHLPWIGEFTVVKTNNLMSQAENKNGDRTWIHPAHIPRLAQRSTHLSDITSPLPPCDTLQNTPNHSSPRNS